jgi:hypothetical protein
MSIAPIAPLATATARPGSTRPAAAPSAPAATATLAYQAGAAVACPPRNWTGPLVGAVLGGLFWGLPGAVFCGLLGYLLTR